MITRSPIRRVSSVEIHVGSSPTPPIFTFGLLSHEQSAKQSQANKSAGTLMALDKRNGSATTARRRADCNQSAMAGFAAHGRAVVCDVTPKRPGRSRGSCDQDNDDRRRQYNRAVSSSRNANPTAMTRSKRTAARKCRPHQATARQRRLKWLDAYETPNRHSASSLLHSSAHRARGQADCGKSGSERRGPAQASA